MKFVAGAVLIVALAACGNEKTGPSPVVSAIGAMAKGSVAKVKAKELNVDEVLYMNVQKNKYAYIVRDSRGIMLYSDERNLYTKLYKGLKITPLES